MNENIILKMVQPYLKNSSITYEEFDSLFEMLSLKEQYGFSEILYKNNIELIINDADSDDMENLPEIDIDEDVFETIKAVRISVESEYSGDVEEYGFMDLDYADFIDVDLHPLCRDVLNAAYHVTDAAELPQIFYEYYKLKPFQRVTLSSVFSKKEWKERQIFLSAFEKVIEENGRKEDWQKKLLAEIGELSCE